MRKSSLAASFSSTYLPLLNDHFSPPKGVDYLLAWMISKPNHQTNLSDWEGSGNSDDLVALICAVGCIDLPLIGTTPHLSSPTQSVVSHFAWFHSKPLDLPFPPLLFSFLLFSSLLLLIHPMPSCSMHSPSFQPNPKTPYAPPTKLTKPKPPFGY